MSQWPMSHSAVSTAPIGNSVPPTLLSGLGSSSLSKVSTSCTEGHCFSRWSSTSWSSTPLNWAYCMAMCTLPWHRRHSRASACARWRMNTFWASAWQPHMQGTLQEQWSRISWPISIDVVSLTSTRKMAYKATISKFRKCLTVCLYSDI